MTPDPKRASGADKPSMRRGFNRRWQVNPAAAEAFLGLFAAEHPDVGRRHMRKRRRDVLREIEWTGQYRHTPAELTFGARVAWRNANRCIGRLYWRSLGVRDLRHVDQAAQVADACAEHLRVATNQGKIRPTITVFAPATPTSVGPRIWNEQLIRYAGYRLPDGQIQGDPGQLGFTDQARRLGWPGGPGGRFDVLPLVCQSPDRPPELFELPSDAVMEVPLRHPEHDWFLELGLRWHVVPALSVMCLEIGGLHYPCAPFNGWYMSSEIGARNFADADRYNMLGEVAEQLGLDCSSDRTLWKDRALVELNRAVLFSFDAAGVTIADHHTESHRFLTHLAREEQAGRVCPADWSWIVPPISGGLTGVFHRYYNTSQLSPAFTHHPEQLALARGNPIP